MSSPRGTTTVGSASRAELRRAIGLPRSLGAAAFALGIVSGSVAHAKVPRGNAVPGFHVPAANAAVVALQPCIPFDLAEGTIVVADVGVAHPDSGSAWLAEAETTIVLRSHRSGAFEATVLSLAATAGPIAYLLADPESHYEFDWPILAAFGGVMLGPAVGYVYAGMPGRGLAGVGIRVLALGVAGVSGDYGLLVVPLSAGYDIVMLAPNIQRRDRRRVIELRTERLRTTAAPALAVHVTF